MSHHFVTLGLGANCGLREENLRKAIELLSSWLDDVVYSHIYETPTVSYTCVSQSGCSSEKKGNFSTYLNAVLEGVTDLSASTLDCKLKEMEVAFGRDDEARERGEVPLDIDIVIFDGEVIRPRDFAHSFFRIGFNSLHPEYSAVELHT